jgi:S-(hydroxymethyl)glutathione dehydrogenase/alcohol dehydrogenase
LIPFESAALLGCAVATGMGAALYSADVRRGDLVVVIGAGGVGLNVVQGARMRGAATILAVDPDPKRRALAAAFGATAGIDPGCEDVEAAVRRHGDGQGADHVFEVVGRVELMSLSLSLLGRGGTLTLVGAAPRDAKLSFTPRQFMSDQHRIVGCIYGDVDPARDLAMFAQWYLDGTLQLDPLLGRSVGLRDVPALFDAPADRSGVRTVVHLEDPS